MLHLSQTLFFIEIIILATVIFMHLSKKSSSVVVLYALQSLSVTVLLLVSALKEVNLALLAVTILIFAAKVIVAPYFFLKLLKKNQLKFSVSSYLNTPLTLIVLTILTGLTHANFFKPIAVIAPANGNALLMAIAIILISIFLIINRRGALSQMIGILSLENAIVSFAFFAGLEQTPGLELGVTFDIITWIVIATVFVSMIHKQFGSLDVTSMKHLTE